MTPVQQPLPPVPPICLNPCPPQQPRATASHSKQQLPPPMMLQIRQPAQPQQQQQQQQDNRPYNNSNYQGRNNYNAPNNRPAQRNNNGYQGQGRGRGGNNQRNNYRPTPQQDLRQDNQQPGTSRQRERTENMDDLLAALIALAKKFNQ